MQIQSLTVDIPPNEWLTANGRFGHPMARATRVKRLRQRAHMLARARSLRSVSGLVRIEATVIGRQKRRSDPNNAADATKALVDGLRDAGVLADDDYSHVIGPDHRVGEPDSSLPKGWHRIVLEVTKLDATVRV